MSKEHWFTAFERNLAENGWEDDMRRDDLYEDAANKAWEEIQRQEAPEEEE